MGYVTLNVRVTVNGEFVRTWTEVAVACFRALSQHLSGRTEGNSEWAGQYYLPVSDPMRFYEIYVRKAKLPLCFIKPYYLKTYGGLEAVAPLILNLVIRS
jgi:hypothetical protein